MSFADTLRADRRLVILRLLEQAPSYSANDSIMRTGLRDIGHDVPADVVRADLAWLAEQDLVHVELVHTSVKTIHVARLTERGLDVAAGRATVPGVSRPAPV